MRSMKPMVMNGATRSFAEREGSPQMRNNSFHAPEEVLVSHLVELCGCRDGRLVWACHHLQVQHAAPASSANRGSALTNGISAAIPLCAVLCAREPQPEHLCQQV